MGARSAPLGAVMVVLVAASAASPAEAKLETYTFNHGPFRVAPYQVRYTDSATRAVRAPHVNGFIVRMYARVVDRRGRPLPVRRIMLHHVLFKNYRRSRGARGEPICGHQGESFYGTGEENQPLVLPRGYGYRIRARDQWRMSWMLMNHQNRTNTAFIQYRVIVETRRRLKAVTPYWIRVTKCRSATDPIFNVPGGGPPGSTVRRASLFQLPRAGRLVSANAHVHGGSKDLMISQPRCGDRPLMSSKPLYGLPGHPYYNVLPVLHEPGPIATSWPRTATGIPVSAGEPLRITSLYDGELPHTRVMAIMHLYVHHGRAPPAAGCAPLPGDMVNYLPAKPGRPEPPRVRVPLTGVGAGGRARTISKPIGPTRVYSGDAAVRIRERSYSVRNLSIPLGASVSWRSLDPIWHNATLANGPVGFSSPMLDRRERYSQRFTKPGLYRLFCTLHPVDMTQAIRVRSATEATGG